MKVVRRRSEKTALVLIALITFWVFLPVLQNRFIDWDNKTLVDNLAYRGLGWPELRWIFAEFHFGKYEPLVWLTFAFDHVLWWADPFGYHWTTLVLHIINATGVYLLALRLFSVWSSAMVQADGGALKIAAGLSALLFAIHPLRAEPVAWAGARSEILAALFFLCSILTYLHAILGSQSRWRQAKWMTMSVFAYGLSLLSGMSGLALPGVLLVLDVYPLGRFADTRNWLGSEARRLYREKSPYLLIALAVVCVAAVANNAEPSAHATSNGPLIKEFARSIAAPVFYFWKAIVPFGLSPVYELPAWFLVLGALAVLALNVWIYSIRNRWPSLMASWVCYLMLLWLVFNDGFFGLHVLADRGTYLSGLPWALLIGAAAVSSWQAYYRGRVRPRVWLSGAGLAAVVLVALGALTSAQTRVWHDSETLWKNAAAGTGTSKANYNLAVLQEAKGNYDDAIEAYKKAAAIDLQRWDAHEKAAFLLQKQGKIREAVEQFQSAVWINPAATESRDNLASGLVTLGKVGDAVQHFRKVLDLAPDRNETRLKLATVLAVQGHLTEAEQLFEEAVKTQPSDPKILLRLGQVSAAQGNLHKALGYFQQALSIQPQDPEIHESLGRVLQELGRPDEAVKHLREALRILKSTPASR